MEKEKYTHDEKCTNCSYINNFNIPKGIRINDYIQEQECFRCGCNLHVSKKKIFS